MTVLCGAPFPGGKSCLIIVPPAIPLALPGAVLPTLDPLLHWLQVYKAVGTLCWNEAASALLFFALGGSGLGGSSIWETLSAASRLFLLRVAWIRLLSSLCAGFLPTALF